MGPQGAGGPTGARDHRNGVVSSFVRLYDQVGLSLIVEAPTGVVYSNQTGGTACLQPELEGALLPLGNCVELPSNKLISPEEDLCEYFEGVHDGTGATNGLSDADADVIDAALDKWRIGWVRVDRSRLRESHEAWVYALLSPEPEAQVPLFWGFDPYPARGVLTWSNSD